MRLIDADELINNLAKAIPYIIDDAVTDAYVEGLGRAKIEIESMPTIEPEQKTGKWKPWKAYYGKDHKSWSDELKCSECDFKWGDEEYKYCPMCGAEMEEPDE